MLGKITRDLGQVFKNLEGRSLNCEYKYDGQRAQIHMDDNEKITIFSRNLEVTRYIYWNCSL
jgi:DNA ligase-1